MDMHNVVAYRRTFAAQMIESIIVARLLPLSNRHIAVKTTYDIEYCARIVPALQPSPLLRIKKGCMDKASYIRELPD